MRQKTYALLTHRMPKVARGAFCLARPAVKLGGLRGWYCLVFGTDDSTVFDAMRAYEPDGCYTGSIYHVRLRPEGEV